MFPKESVQLLQGAIQTQKESGTQGGHPLFPDRTAQHFTQGSVLLTSVYTFNSILVKEQAFYGVSHVMLQFRDARVVRNTLKKKRLGEKPMYKEFLQLRDKEPQTP